MSYLKERAGQAKQKGKNCTIWLEWRDGEPASWLIETPTSEKRSKRFSDLMNWSQKHQIRIEYTTLRPDIGELDRRINAR